MTTKSTTKAKTTTKKPVKERTISNKEVVFKLWLKNPTTKIAAKCHAAVNEAVELNTVRGWLSMWAHAKGLPRICRQDDDVMTAAKAAMKRAATMKKESATATE